MPPLPKVRIAALLLVSLVTLLRAVDAPSSAADNLAAHFAQLKNEKTLSARFICEKRLAALDTPLLSSGRLWIQKDQLGNSTINQAVRFSTETPYISELILTNGKVFARSQHETEWTTTNQSTRPGLTAVMSQLGSWSTGDAAKLNDFYAVSTSDLQLPALPSTSTTQSSTPKSDTDAFTLTPTNPDLAKAIKQLTLILDRHNSSLLFLEIQTQQGDTTRYWFLDSQANPQLPANVFQPGTDLLLPSEQKP